jgi:hypothetical protein
VNDGNKVGVNMVHETYNVMTVLPSSLELLLVMMIVYIMKIYSLVSRSSLYRILVVNFSILEANCSLLKRKCTNEIA